MEENKKQAAVREIESKGQKSLRQIQAQEAERLRAEVRNKIQNKIKEIVKREEEAARKVVEEEHEIDEEFYQNLLNKDTEIKAKAQSPDKGDAAGGKSEDDDGEEGEEEEEDMNQDDNSVTSEEYKRPETKKKTGISMLSAVNALMKQEQDLTSGDQQTTTPTAKERKLFNASSEAKSTSDLKLNQSSEGNI